MPTCQPRPCLARAIGTENYYNNNNNNNNNNYYYYYYYYYYRLGTIIA